MWQSQIICNFWNGQKWENVLQLLGCVDDDATTDDIFLDEADEIEPESKTTEYAPAKLPILY